MITRLWAMKISAHTINISKYECIYKYMVKVDFRSAVQMSMDDANKFRLITC